MDDNTLLLIVALLGCPIMMGMMMWMMNKQMGTQHDHMPLANDLPADPAARLTTLQQQRQKVDAEIHAVVEAADSKVR